MRKLLAALSLVLILIFVGCTPRIHILRGSYQSEREGSEYVVFLTFNQYDNSFTEYIDNREVDKGTYDKIENNRYIVKSDKQNFEIFLDAKNYFEITINKLNDGKPIQMKNIDVVPTYFDVDYEDIDTYKALLDE